MVVFVCIALVLFVVLGILLYLAVSCFLLLFCVISPLRRFGFGFTIFDILPRVSSMGVAILSTFPPSHFMLSFAFGLPFALSSSPVSASFCWMVIVA